MSVKRGLLTQAFAATAVAVAATATFSQLSAAQPAPGQKGFYCDTSSSVPTTMYQNSQGIREPWIKWVSEAFSASGYDPVRRCLEVSGRLETYRRNKQLKYITVGRMNGEDVVCTASAVNESCEGLIFTLKPGQDAVKTLNNLLTWREGQAGAPPLLESDDSDQIPYIDVSGRLGEDEPSAAPARPVPSNPVPAAPQ
ncbi:MAG: COP23 domain-containing protein [Oscillatoria sp. Prado101]|jgi:hypothetical protein|nr:COP23 domain-containing protein [Oscillatoria sp. Prado101]